MAGRKKKQEKPGEGPKAGKEERPGVRVSEIPGQVSLERSPFKLSGNIQYLSTDIDSLYSYVLENKSVGISAAAKRFKVGNETIEEWGRILEDHHMLELHYPVAGEPTLRIPTPRGVKTRKHKDKKEKKKGKKPGKPMHLRLTRKRLLIMAEIIVLGELFIYIFLVNPHLRDNFIPTLNYQITNFIPNLMNLPNYLSGRSLLINPLYFLIGIIIVVFWIALVIMNKRKKAEKKPKQPR